MVGKSFKKIVFAIIAAISLFAFGASGNFQISANTASAKMQAVKGITLHVTGQDNRKVNLTSDADGKVTIHGKIKGDKKITFTQYKGGYRKFTVKAHKNGSFKKTIKIQSATNKVAYKVDSHKTNQLISKHSKKYTSHTRVIVTIKRSAASQASEKASSQAASSSSAAASSSEAAASSKAASEAAASSSQAAAAAQASSQAAAQASSQKVAAAQAASRSNAAQAAAAAAAANNPGEQRYVDANGNGLIKGSVDHIYHIPGSTYYARTKHVVQWFKTTDEAERAGYRAPLR
ncbi:hypothetical protein [Oenococcus sicerae]|uniref:sunset domain-containing protein n=1 Tax=Oenococcus sicerae TaxID=2203724 RepID=UPI0010B78601|nr:hypothetical protein OAL24_00344 [Oenococcus sicerae]